MTPAATVRDFLYTGFLVPCLLCMFPSNTGSMSLLAWEPLSCGPSRMLCWDLWLQPAACGLVLARGVIEQPESLSEGAQHVLQR